MSREMMLGMLRQGNTGSQILQILDVIVNDIVEANIQDCADYYAAISDKQGDAVSYSTGEAIVF